MRQLNRRLGTIGTDLQVQIQPERDRSVGKLG
ncbi:hypothetical protein OGM63_21960 [Plectonema radiosum NIES-515]|uniref:Uncharacterized protein n=1 Tax=Plectonema radiosum NIES-515 TaxID=2986073 RepID=A0ABT3B442_9CYAN|nr:hypothetical protein [Plectonema radiosum NIES-515]